MIQITFRAFFIGLLILASVIRVEAQEPVPVKVTDQKVVIDGKVYYLHSVKPGQTLYSISKAYKVREKDIALENPGVYSGLQIGQVLKIPVITPDIPGEEKEGYDTTRYLQHILIENQNLYSLSRMYNVTVEDIEKVNPDIDHRDLAIGQGILIPRINTVVSDDSFIIHKVRRSETLYSLSRRYNVEERDIKHYNPELQWGELKAGQVIKIPRPWILSETAEQSEEMEMVDSLTLFTPQEEVLVIQPEDTLPRVDLRDMMYQMRDINARRLKVAFMIPFNYREDMRIEKERDAPAEEDETDEEEELLPGSINFLEFLEGSLLALDSLRSEGINVDVHYYDTKRSPTRIREILREFEMRDMDLIIGPFFTYNVEIVSEFSRRHGIPMVSPFHSEDIVTRSNPFLFQLNPGFRTEFRNAAKILARDFDKNFVFIYSADSIEFPKKDFFKHELIQELNRYTHPGNVIIKEIIYDNTAKANLSADLIQTLSRDKVNIVVIPEDAEAFVSPVITQLYFKLRDFDIRVFGLPHWSEFDNVNVQYLHELNARYLSPYYYNYEDEEVMHFLAKYRENFKSEPSLTTKKGSKYAFTGYDITYYFLRLLSMYERRFLLRINDLNYQSLLPEYEFHRYSDYGGFENRGMYLVEYLPDYNFLVRRITEQPDFDEFRFRTPFMDDLRP